jgi:ribokinase
MSKILVVGSINMDMVVRTAHMPAPGETVLGWDFKTIPGGKGANQAVGISRLGGQVVMIGKLGRDEFGQTLRDTLHKEQIDVSHIRFSDDAPNGIALITLDGAGQNCIVVASGANMALTPEEVIESWQQIKPVDVVVTQLEIPVGCVMAAAKVAKEAGAKVILIPAPAQDLPDELLSRVDILVPNESELELLTAEKICHEQQAEAAARRMLEKGVGQVVLTLGSRGALVVEREKVAIKLSPYQVDVVDTTAAGDAFVAGLAFKVAEGAPLLDATNFGNAAGALAVTQLGAQPAMPTLKKVENLLNTKI